MKVNNSVLTLDIKIEDKFRNMLANLSSGMPRLTGVILGDSDIDYDFPDIKNARIHNAPYNINKIRYPLIFSGGEKGMEGYITTFVRKIVDTTDYFSVIINPTCRIDSMYSYPGSNSFISGGSPPTLGNGYDWDTLDFEDAKMGYIIYFQVILFGHLFFLHKYASG